MKLNKEIQDRIRSAHAGDTTAPPLLPAVEDGKSSVGPVQPEPFLAGSTLHILNRAMDELARAHTGSEGAPYAHVVRDDISKAIVLVTDISYHLHMWMEFPEDYADCIEGQPDTSPTSLRTSSPRSAPPEGAESEQSATSSKVGE